MVHRFLGSRAFMTLAGLVLVAVVVAGVYVVVGHPLRKMNSYCALMPDSIGLYRGNQVAIRGVPVGSVKSIEPQGRGVRVDFTVDADYPLAADVSATTLSNTIVADRELAVLSAGTVKEKLKPDQCITKTLTPKSMTATLTALADLSSQTLGSDPAHDDALSRGLHALNSATAGTGPQVNEIIHKLGTALDSPDAAIGNLAGAIDALSSLAASISTHWGDIKSMLVRLDSVLDQVNNELFSRTVEIIDGFQKVLPMLNDITTLFGDPIFQVLDATVPLARFAGAHVAELRDIIDMIPPITSAFTRVTDPHTSRPGLIYASPHVAVPREEVAKICATAKTVAADRCTDSKAADIPLAALVLGMAGAR